MAFSGNSAWLKEKQLLVFYPLVATGIILACINYFNNRSLWFDEVLLSLNIVTKNYNELAAHLDYAQVAPIGYLWATKTMVLLFGPDEMSLRLLSFMSYLASIFIFYQLSLRISEKKAVALIAVAFFALNISLLYYSAEVKQYIVEVFMAILLVNLVVGIKPRSFFRMTFFCLAGCLSVYFSLSSVIVLMACCLYLFYHDIYKAKNYRIFWVFGVFAINLVFYYFAFLHAHPTSDLMVSMHENYFLPANPFSAEFWQFIYFSFRTSYMKLMGFGSFYIIALVFTFVAIGFLLFKKRYTEICFFSLVVIIHLGLSLFKIYPFSDRFILYHIPFFILILSSGMFYVWEFFSQRLFKLPIIILALPVLIMVYPAISQVPFHREEIKDSLVYLHENIEEGDGLYLYYASTYPFDYYVISGFIPNHPALIRGEISRDKWEAYLEHFEGYTGRLWLIFSHVYPFSDTDKENEEHFIMNSLLEQGARLMDIQKTTGSSIYLVQLDD